MSWQEEEIARRRQEQAEKDKRLALHEARSRKIQGLWNRFLEQNRSLPRELQLPVTRTSSGEGNHFVESINYNQGYRSHSHYICYSSRRGCIFFEVWKSAAGSGLNVKYSISYDADGDYFFACSYSPDSPPFKPPEPSTGYYAYLIDNRAIEILIRNLCRGSYLTDDLSYVQRIPPPEVPRRKRFFGIF
jgi:hypothetical protein